MMNHPTTEFNVSAYICTCSVFLYEFWEEVRATNSTQNISFTDINILFVKRQKAIKRILSHFKGHSSFDSESTVFFCSIKNMHIGKWQEHLYIDIHWQSIYYEHFKWREPKCKGQTAHMGSIIDWRQMVFAAAFYYGMIYWHSIIIERKPTVLRLIFKLSSFSSDRIFSNVISPEKEFISWFSTG